jgi:hypothetical protein
MTKYSVATGHFNTVCIRPHYPDCVEQNSKYQKQRDKILSKNHLRGHGLAVIPNIFDNMKEWINWENRVPAERALFDPVNISKVVLGPDKVFESLGQETVNNIYDVFVYPEIVTKKKENFRYCPFKWKFYNSSDNKSRLFWLEDYRIKVVEVNSPIKFIDEPK